MVHQGDCREVMAGMDAESVDAIVTDPPYGLSQGPTKYAGEGKGGGFMGKAWDHGVPGAEFWAEALRVAKPGAHLLAFGGTRTYHRLACAIEDAGWEIRDCVMWVYGSGFPKSLDVSKAIDKAAGDNWSKQFKGSVLSDAPITDAARQWQGWGTALKPSYEPVIVARKPLCGTVAENVLRHGTGGINVNGCRVGGEPSSSVERRKGKPLPPPSGVWPTASDRSKWSEPHAGEELGRWPANLIHDGSEEVVGLFPQCKSGQPMRRHHTDPGRQVQSGASRGGVYFHDGYGDSGSAARFFYCAKASKADRDEGCGGLPIRQTTGGGGINDPNGDDVCGKYGSVKAPARNHHPTVKPTALMRYLCRLVTPPGGVVLDPFAGSGSTGKAAILEGFQFVGIEREAEYVEIARARINAARPLVEATA